MKKRYLVLLTFVGAMVSSLKSLAAVVLRPSIDIGPETCTPSTNEKEYLPSDDDQLLPEIDCNSDSQEEVFDTLESRDLIEKSPKTRNHQTCNAGGGGR